MEELRPMLMRCRRATGGLIDVPAWAAQGHNYLTMSRFSSRLRPLVFQLTSRVAATEDGGRFKVREQPAPAQRSGAGAVGRGLGCEILPARSSAST